MLSRIFKTRDPLSQPDPAARRRAVEGLSDAKAGELQERLLELARGDGDPGVRQACLSRLQHASDVAQLLDDESMANRAAERLDELLGPDTSSELAGHPLVLRARLFRMAPEDAAPILDSITDEATLVNLAFGSREPLRGKVLTRVRSAKALSELEQQSRGRDKGLNRFAREGMERIRQLRREAKATLGRLNELADALERASRQEPGTAARQRHDSLMREFDQAYGRYAEHAQALEGCNEPSHDASPIRARVAALEAPAEPVTISPEAAAAAERDTFAGLVPQLQALERLMETGQDFQTLSQTRSRLTEAWLRAADNAPPGEAEHQVFERVSHAYQNLAEAVARLTAAAWEPEREPLPDDVPEDPGDAADFWRATEERRRLLERAEGLVRSVAWPEWASPSEQLRRLLDDVERLREEVARADALGTSRHEELEQLIRTAATAIDEGALRPATQALARARAILQALPGRGREVQARALQHESARLSELRDWQTFATTPKREALCDAIRNLAEQPLDPPDQSERIKALRGEWNRLGPVSGREDRALADRFNRLAEQAFEPCRAYFAEQAEQRESNLAERVGICDQLEHYLDSTDWKAADMKAAEKILRVARDEWRRFHPVDRNPGKPVEERFEALQERLHTLIKAEWDANLQLKRQIVEEAEALANSESDPRDRAQEAKALQRRWREIGITPRGPDRKLWQQFRGACDGIFEALGAAREASSQAVSAALDAADALLSSFESDLENTSPTDAEPEILAGFRRRFGELPPLPEREGRQISRRFDELTRHYSALLHQKSRHEERAELDRLRALDEAVTAMEISPATAAEPTGEALADPIVSERLQRRGQSTPMDALSALTVRAEILAGMESPAQDRELRLRLQVEQMNVGMGSQRRAQDPLQMAREWCARGPKNEACAALRERFFEALARALED